MTKSSAQLDAEIAEALRAKKWQEQTLREDRERRARIAEAARRPSPEQLYEEHQADVAAGVFHGERRGHARQFRRAASAAEALRASETAKHASDDALLAPQQREAAEAHRRAARLHKSRRGPEGEADPAGAEAASLHEYAMINHRQAAKARESRALKAEDPTRTKKHFAAYQEKLAAAKEHGMMAQEYARQALTAARERAP